MRLIYPETGAEFVENETTKQGKQQQLQQIKPYHVQTLFSFCAICWSFGSFTRN